MSESAAASQSQERIPRSFGRYRVVGKIASGGMAVVYLCRIGKKSGFQRLFAVKVMHSHLSEEAEFVTMLMDEARIAAQLHHANVVSTVDLGVEDGRYFVVLEYVDGFSFGDLLKRATTREVSVILRIVIDGLKGLHAAHSATDAEGQLLGLVHRDVSPDNILVGTDGVGRITDFGIATAQARITKTNPGMLKGKAGFMAPEQMMGKDVDARADIFSTGVMLWNALTGEKLYSGTLANNVYKVLTETPTPPSQVGEKPPAALDEVVLKALASAPENRFSTAAEMAQAVEDAARAGDVHVASAEEVGDWVKRLFAHELDQRRKQLRDAPDDDEAFLDSTGAYTFNTASHTGSQVTAVEQGWGPRIAAIVGAAALGVGAALFLQSGEEKTDAPPAIAAPAEEASSGPAAVGGGESEATAAAKAAEAAEAAKKQAEEQAAKAAAEAAEAAKAEEARRDTARKRFRRRRASRNTEAAETQTTPAPAEVTKQPEPQRRAVEENPYLRQR